MSYNFIKRLVESTMSEESNELEGRKKIARWQTRGGKHWFELYQYEDGGGFSYRGDGAGGNLGNMSEEEAIAYIEKRIKAMKEVDGINMVRVSEDSGLQIYGREPAGMMGEAVLTVEDVEKICPECAASMRERNISGVKLQPTLEAGIFEMAGDSDEDAVLIEKDGEDGWPKKLKKGRFTKYCKSSGYDGPSEACAKKAMDSDDDSVRGMASFYMNTVKPKGKTASAVKGADGAEEKCGPPVDKKEGYDEGVSEMVGIDAIRAWAQHRLPEGVRMTTRTILIGNQRVAERHVESKHARIIKPDSLKEDADKRTRDVIERGLRDAGYKVELVDGFSQ